MDVHSLEKCTGAIIPVVIIEEMTVESGLDAVAVRPPSSAEADESTRCHPLYFDRSIVTSVHQHVFQPEHAEFHWKTAPIKRSLR